jgi:hypothetical protein
MAGADALSDDDQVGGLPDSLTGIFDTLLDHTDGQKVSIDSLLSALDNRSYGPLLLLPSLLALGPTGAIPGMSIAMGSVIILIAVQMLFKHGQPWLPDRILSFEFERERLESAVEKSRPYVERLQRLIRPRLTELTTRPWSYAIPVFSILFALTMFPLAVVPFGVALPAAAMTLLSIGMTMKDGYFVLAGYVIGTAALVMLVSLI